jgi:lipocalin-like protein
MTELARAPHSPVGTWKLLSFQYEFEDSDERDEPLGANPVGYLVLTEERLITLTTARERATGAVPSELLGSMIAYSGRYRLQGDDCFITTVDSAWQPSWIGTEQVRVFKMDGEILTVVSPLREHPKYPGRRIRCVAVWRKD